ncbi:hypothetical protein D3C83_153300 [compost metagenome]
MRHDFQQRAGGKHVRAFGERSLRGIRFGQDECAIGGARLQGHRQRASHRTQIAREGQFTRELVRG